MLHAERVFGVPGVAHGVPPCFSSHGEDAMRYLMDGMDDMDGMDGMDGATARVAPTASGKLPRGRSAPALMPLLYGIARTPCATFPRGRSAPALMPRVGYWPLAVRRERRKAQSGWNEGTEMMSCPSGLVRASKRRSTFPYSVSKNSTR